MADRISQAGRSRWYWYQLEPADLAVEAHSPNVDGLSMVWKGGIDAGRLAKFVVAAANAVSPKKPTPCRALVVTETGMKQLEINLDSISAGAMSFEPFMKATYIRFECWKGADVSSPKQAVSDGVRPDLAIWSNRDQSSSNLDDLQQCVGINVKPTDLRALEDEISSIAPSITSPYFKGGTYRPDAVRGCLRQIRNELSHIESAVP
jgi:hypothetical protein